MTVQEPGKIISALLALSVHAAFLLLLMFGVSWQKRMPDVMTVDLWDSLPALPPASAPPPQQPLPPVQQAPAKAERQPSKAEIQFKDKQEKQRREKEKQREQSAQEQARLAALKAQQAAMAEAARLRREQEDALVRLTTERASAQDRVKADFKERIMNKIRRYVVLPPELIGNPQAEYRVTLLPGGDVLNVRLEKSSGNAAYDSALERAIYKAQPLPLPPDPALFSAFRELQLQFRPQQ